MNSPIALLSYILLMGINYPIVRFMSLQFDPLNNNTLRALAGSLLFLAICICKFRAEFYRFLAVCLMCWQCPWRLS